MHQLTLLTTTTLLSLLLLTTTTNAHNITRILADHPEFSSFNHYLSATHLADEINRRRTITVCAVDNSAMNELLSKHFSLPTIKNVLSLHIFADYFGPKKLHQISKGSTTTSSLFQATGEAAGTSGYVNITDLKGGKVAFNPVDGDADQPRATFVKSVHDIAYVISVIQISHVLLSPEAEAPTAGPGDLNVTTLMARQGCLDFSQLVTDQGADEIFASSVQGGLTVFCPSDESLNSFMPRYKNLTAEGKTSLILYHAMPVYESLGMLRSSNGLVRTLATEGAAKKYHFTVKNDGDNVKVETKVVTATIKGTLIDEDPLAVYKIDKVLLPRELFNAAPPSPAPKSAPRAARARSASGGGGDDDANAPVTSDDDVAADQDSSSNGGTRRICGGGFIVSVFVGVLVFVF